MALVVVGSSPTTGEVLVKDTATGEMEWKKGTAGQVSSVSDAIQKAGSYYTGKNADFDSDYEDPVPKKKVNDNQDLLDMIAELQAKIDKLTKTKTTTELKGGLLGETPLSGGDVTGEGSEIPWQEVTPEAGWASAFGIPAMGQTPVQSWLAGQAAPAYAGYMAGSYLNPQENPMDWAGYMGNSGWKGAQTSAKNLFGQALSDPNGQNSFVDIMGDYLNDFMKNVLGNYYAAPIANKLAGKVGALQTQYTGETKGQGTSFLDYLTKKYNLGGLIGGNNTTQKLYPQPEDSDIFRGTITPDMAVGG